MVPRVQQEPEVLVLKVLTVLVLRVPEVLVLRVLVLEVLVLEVCPRAGLRASASR